MSAGSVQIIATGPQDKFITGDPEVSFFGVNYKRHTNFALTRQQQLLQGKPIPGGRSKINFERLGDLLGPVYITVVKDGETQLIDDWANVVHSCELYIGGSLIDTQDVQFTEEIAIDTMATTLSKSYPASLHGGKGSDSFFYPMRFFFCENWGSAIPVAGLQYHDVEIMIKWADNYDTSYKVEVNAYYITLDEAERQSITQERNMLIFQVQKALPTHQRDIDLSFNHPVKFLASSNANPSQTNTLVSRQNIIRMIANGVDIIEPQLAVPHFTAVPSFYNTDYSYSNSENTFIHPFCLNTAKLQPTGALNFSRLDSFIITCEESINTPIYAVNYNILKVKNGLGGLLFAN